MEVENLRIRSHVHPFSTSMILSGSVMTYTHQVDIQLEPEVQQPPLVVL